jgi:hypothetical protein
MGDYQTEINDIKNDLKIVNAKNIAFTKNYKLTYQQVRLTKGGKIGSTYTTESHRQINCIRYGFYTNNHSQKNT